MRNFAKWPLILLAFTPLVVSSTTLNPTLYGKVMFLRIALLATALMTVYAMIDKPRFRIEIRDRVMAARKNPLAIALTVFLAAATVSTVFAVSPYKAFFGDVSRCEGLIGLIAFYALFVFTYLLFSYRDWQLFFRLSLITSLILFGNTVTQALGGMERPGSFIGNPEFLAGYYIFTLFCAVAVFNDAVKRDIWRYVAVIGGIAGVAGIVLTQTRGTLLALAVGLAATALYLARRRGGEKLFGKVSLKMAILSTAMAMALFAGVVFMTRDAPVWKKVPGVSRILTSTTNTATIKTRLVSAKVSYRAATESGILRGTLGYGQDNYNVAYNKFYDTEYYRYEHGWFDRAHNKLFDVWIMQGLLGLLAYLAIWALFAWLIFWRQPYSADRLALWMFGAIYFTHVIMVFDHLTTYIELYGLFAFAVSLSVAGRSANAVAETTAPKTKAERRAAKKNRAKEAATPFWAGVIVCGLFTAGAAWTVVFWTLVPFAQMSNYRALVPEIRKPDGTNIVTEIDGVLTPFNYAQQELRTDLLRRTVDQFGLGSSAADQLFLKALAKADEAAVILPHKPLHLVQIGLAYDQKAYITKDPADHKKAEAYFRNILELTPYRQDVSYNLAANLMYQKRIDEAVKLMEDEYRADPLSPETRYYLGFMQMQQGGQMYATAMSNMEPGYSTGFFENPSTGLAVYKKMAKYFYETGDTDNLRTAIRRLHGTLDTPNRKKYYAAWACFKEQCPAGPASLD